MWDHLIDDDVIHVESPRDPAAVPKELSHISVMGAAGQTYGLAFFASLRGHERLVEADDPANALGKGAWTLQFDAPRNAPFADIDLWEREGLPAAGPKAYPYAYRYSADGPPARADAKTLAYLEGLLRAGDGDRG